MTNFLARAQALISQHRFDMAEKELRLLVADQPELGYAHSLLALCLTGLERRRDAERAAARGVELEPSEAFSHYAMAIVHLDADRPPEAEASIRQSIELEPEDADYRGTLAKVHLARGEWSQALAAAEEGLRLEAEHEFCTNAKAISLTKLGRASEAATEIETALRLDPEDSMAHASKGWLLLHGGRGGEGIVHFREALRLDPTDEYARQGLVEALKARSRLYGWILAGFLWLTRFSRKTQVYILIGAFVLYRVLRSFAKSNPEFAPFVLPLLILYNLIWLTSWFARPFFNLLLRLDREGRLALNEHQTREANVFGLLVAGILLSIGLIIGGFPLALVAAIYFAGMLFPTMSYFDCEPGWPRTLMAIVSIGMGCLGVLACALFLLRIGSPLPTLALAFGIGVLFSMIVGPFLSLVTPKR